MKKLRELNLAGKRVIVRIECNVPLSGGEIQNDARLRRTVPTLEYILEQKPQQIILIGHQGRPNGVDEKLRLNVHAKFLSELLGEEIVKLDDCGQTTPSQDAKIVMLENLRFYDEKSKDNKKRTAFAKKIAELGDVYVNDAFGACHRDHASIVDLPNLMAEKCAGLLLTEEIEKLSPLIQDYKKPLVLVIGGNKIDTKVDILKNYLERADVFLVGGGLANTFLEMRGLEVGKSIHEKNKNSVAREIFVGAKDILLPTDAVTTQSISPNSKVEIKKLENVTDEDSILDIGAQTIAKFCEVIKSAGTVIWNGPMGLFELNKFGKGTEEIAKAIASSGAYSVIGGGDTLEACQKFGIDLKKFSHASTGGGAMIAFLEGKKLPGIEALN